MNFNQFDNKFDNPEFDNKDDSFYMNLALEQAAYADKEGEVPVGAVAVWDDGTRVRVVGIGRNRREQDKNALCHAEIEAINNACNTLGGWRLHKCTLYVTLEPCPMCGGAIVNSRIKRVVFGCRDEKSGSFGSVFNLNDLPLNHKPEITEGVMEETCRNQMSSFFTRLREQRRLKKNNEKNNF
jgi:tRNA(adenine34) deaminase